MARTSLPPGFRFHPTDVELIMYYLKRKVIGKKFYFPAIAELNIYKFSPWDLADKSLLKTRDLEWYFFSPIEKKYGSGGRTNRATETGYWKTTGKDRSVTYNGRTVGMIKTLVFYKGHAPKGERTDWVMHEYRIEDKHLADVGIIQDSFVVCKLFQKSGLGPKNGAQYGAPFSEEEWDEMDYVESSHGDFSFLSVDYQPTIHNNCAAVSLAGARTSGSWPTSELVPYPAQPLAMQCPMANPTSNDIFELSSICTEDKAMSHIGNNKTENARVPSEALQRTGSGPKSGSTVSHHEVHDVEEICAYQCLNQNDSALSSSIVPRATSSPVVSAPEQSPATPSAINMLPDMDDLAAEDITALLSMFTESSSMIPSENTNKRSDTIISKDTLTCQDKNALYDGLGDLDNLVVPTKSGFDFSNTWDTAYNPNQILMDDDMIFLELKDLDAPLTHPAKATDAVWGQTERSYAPYTYYHNMDGSYHKGVLQNAAQNVSTLNQTSVLPQGPGWMEDILEVPMKGTGTRRLEGYGSDTSMGNGIGYLISCRQPEESTITEQIQRRGEPQRTIRLQLLLECMYDQSGSAAELFAHMITAEIFYGGSSMYFKAEVALKVGKCTDDALSHNMGESTFCWGKMPVSNLGEKVVKRGPNYEPIIYHWEVSFVLKCVCSPNALESLKIWSQLSKHCFHLNLNSIIFIRLNLFLT